MPARCTKIRQLKSRGSVVRSLDYIYDEELKRASHEGYQILPDKEKEALIFADAIEWALAVLNREADPAHKIKLRASWVIARVPDNSFLSEAERDILRVHLIKALGCDSHRWAWHLNRLNGSADFNLVFPAVTLHDHLPRLRRWVGQSMWCRAKSASDDAFESINTKRSSTGREPIPSIAAVQQQRADERGGSLERILSRSAEKTGLPISIKTLPVLLDYAGVNRTDWSIDEDELRWRREKHRMKMKLEAIIAAANATNTSSAAVSERSISVGLTQSHLRTKLGTASEGIQPESACKHP